jgi:DnaJ-class molecular chaperone
MTEFVTVACDRCSGERISRDSTLADKVGAGSTVITCPRCHGAGTRERLRSAIEAERQPFVPSGAPVGDMPDWMM